MDILSKKVLIPAIVAAVVIGAVLTVPPLVASAAEERMGHSMPQINGTVNAGDAMRNYLNENVDVTFAQATETAQAEVEDGRIVGGHLGVVQGYVVYKFLIVDPDGTGYMTIIDAGNGEVLYTSEGMEMGAFHGPMGYGGQGHWKGHGGFWHGAGWR